MPLRYMLVAAIALALPGLSAPNIYPDPGFEQNGVAGDAHSGEKAGVLRVAEKTHWGALGGPLEVEPFARYRASVWVKVISGTFLAPHCVDWDSYEWAFDAAVPVRSSGEWVHSETTFISPNSTMNVSPLAYIEAENAEALVDDVVVEKIQEPAEAMAEILGKAQMDGNEQRLAARWLLRQGDVEGAAGIMRRAEGLARADIATVIALALPEGAARRPYVVEAVAYGGPTYHEGMDRFAEMTTGMDAGEKLDIALQAIELNPDLDRAARALSLIVSGTTDTGGPRPIAEMEASLLAQDEAVQKALAMAPAGSAAADELRIAAEATGEAKRQMEERKARLGSCSVTLDGHPVTPESHRIVVPDEPTPQESYAAADLRCHLELLTGKLYALCGETEADGRPGFYVGNTRRAQDSALDLPSLKLEGIHIKTDGPSVLLAGNQRGVLYATYQFLEDYLGCRWFAPDCSTWPREGTLAVPEIDRRYIPPLEYRGGDYPIARPGDFAVRLRLNGANHQMTAEQGSRVGVHSLAHTFAALCPPEKYFAEHPEYFSLVNGERQFGYSQLCLTNPDVLRICTEGVRRWIRQLPDCKVFSVSQNDTWGYCECEKCRAVAEEEGSQSGPVVRFVNAIADAIRDEAPDVAIETLAYQYTRKPPLKAKPRPNVIICLCSIECCFAHTLADCEANRSFADDIRGWNQICDRLWIWDYVINYAHSVCPFPNLQVIRPNIEFFIENGVKGIYEESCYFTRGSELQELRNYLIAKTLWDPSYDTEQAVHEFCAAYYGPAAPHILGYLELAEKTVTADPTTHMMIFSHPSSYLKAEMIPQARELFDRAEAAVGQDATLLHRVQVARLPVIYAEIALSAGGTWSEEEDRLVQVGGADVSALADEFERIAGAAGLTMVREGGPLSSVDAWLDSLQRHERSLDTLGLDNGLLKLTVLPGLGGRIWRLQTNTGRDILKVHGAPGDWEPGSGGYEEYSGADYRSAGWNEAYEVLERDDTSVTLQADLRNGLRLNRTIALEAGRALVKITSTLSNPGGEPKPACLRLHPEFSIGSAEMAKVLLGRADGTWTAHNLANPEDPDREIDAFFTGQKTPQGVWALVDEAGGIAVVNRIAPEQVDRYLANRSGLQNRATLEVYSPQRDLAAGENITMESSYEVVAASALE